MTISTAVAALAGQSVITAGTAPLAGYVNTYNASSGSLTPPLPALSGLNPGAWLVIEKDNLDASGHTVTFSAFGSDSFQDGTTSIALSYAGALRMLMVIQPAATKYWKLIGGLVGSLENNSGVPPKRVTSNTSSPSTLTISTDTVDLYKISSLGNGLVLSVSGSPRDGDQLKVTIKDNGTSQPLGWSSSFTVMGVIGGLPGSTPPGKKMTCQFVYDSDISKWVLSAVDSTGY